MHLSRIQALVVTWCSTILYGFALVEPRSSAIEPFPELVPSSRHSEAQSANSSEVSSDFDLIVAQSRQTHTSLERQQYEQQAEKNRFPRSYKDALDPRSYAIKTDPNAIPYVALPIAPLGGGPSYAFDPSYSGLSLTRHRQGKPDLGAWLRLSSWWTSQISKARWINHGFPVPSFPISEPFPPFEPFPPGTIYCDERVSDTQAVNLQSSPGRISKDDSYVVDSGTCPQYMADIIDHSMAETIDILEKAEERMLATAQVLNRDTKWYKFRRIGQRKTKLRQLPIEVESFLRLWQVIYGGWTELKSCDGGIPMQSRIKDLWNEQRQSDLQNLIDTTRYIREKINGSQGRVLSIFCGTSWLRPRRTSDPESINVYRDHRPSTYFTHLDWVLGEMARFESYHQFEVWLDPNDDPMHIPAIPWSDVAGKYSQLIALNPRYNMIWANATQHLVSPSKFGHFVGGLNNTKLDAQEISLDTVLKIYLSAQFIPLLSLLIKPGPSTNHLRKHVCAGSQGHRPRGMPSLQTGPCWVQDPDYHRYNLVNSTASAWNFAYFVVALYNPELDWSSGYANETFSMYRMHENPVCWGSNFYIPTLRGTSPSDPNWKPEVTGSGSRHFGYQFPQSISLQLHSPNRGHTMHNPPVMDDSFPLAANLTSRNLKRSLFDPSDQKKPPSTKGGDEQATPPPPTRRPPAVPPPNYEFNKPFLGSLGGVPSTASRAGSDRGGRPGESSASGGRLRDDSPVPSVPSVPSWRTGPSSDGASTPARAPSSDGASTPPRAPSPDVVSSIARCISGDPSVSSGDTPARRPIKEDPQTHNYYAVSLRGTICDASDEAQPEDDAEQADGRPPAYQPIATTKELYRKGGYAIDHPTCGTEGTGIISKAVLDATEIARAAQKRLNDLIIFLDKHQELWLTAPAAWARQDLTLQSTLRTWEALYGRPKPHFSDKFQTKSPNTAPEKKHMKRRFWDARTRSRVANIRDTNRNILWGLLSRYEYSGHVVEVPRNTTVFICGTAYLRPDNILKGKSGFFDHWFDERPDYFFQYPHPKYRKVGFDTGGRGLFGSPNSNLRVPDMMWDNRQKYGEWYNLMIMLNTKDFLLTWETTSQPQFSLANLRKKLQIYTDEDVIHGLGPFLDGTGYQLEQTWSDKDYHGELPTEDDLYGDPNSEDKGGPSGSGRDYPQGGDSKTAPESEDSASESEESASESGRTTPRPAEAAPDPEEPGTSGNGGRGRMRDDDSILGATDGWDRDLPPALIPAPGEGAGHGWKPDDGLSDADLPYASVSDDGSEPPPRIYDYYTQDREGGSSEEPSGGGPSAGKPSRKGKERAPFQRRSDVDAARRPKGTYERKVSTKAENEHLQAPSKKAAGDSLPTHNNTSSTTILAKRGKKKEAEAAQQEAPTDGSWVQSLDLDYLWGNYLASQILYSTSLSASMTEFAPLRKGQQLCSKANACCKMPANVKVTPHADTFACSTGLAQSANNPYDNALKNVWNFVFFDLAMYLDGRDWSTGKAQFLNFEKDMPLEEQPPKIKWFEVPRVAFRALANALEPFPGG